MKIFTNLPFSIRSFDFNQDWIEPEEKLRQQYEVILFVTGDGIKRLNDAVFDINSGSVHFVPVGVHCSFQLGVKAKGYVITFAPDFYIEDGTGHNFVDALSFFKLGGDHMIEPELDSLIQLQNLVSKLMTEYGSDDVHLEIIKSYMKILLLRCCQLITDDCDKANIRGTDLTRFLELVEQHFIEKHKVSDYADLLHITQKQLLKVVKVGSGNTPGQIIADRRIQEAKQLLRNDVMSNKAIAYHLNFEDPGHFSKFFKNKTGKSPNTYREEKRKMYMN